MQNACAVHIWEHYEFDDPRITRQANNQIPFTVNISDKSMQIEKDLNCPFIHRVQGLLAETTVTQLKMSFLGVSRQCNSSQLLQILCHHRTCMPVPIAP